MGDAPTTAAGVLQHRLTLTGDRLLLPLGLARCPQIYGQSGPLPPPRASSASEIAELPTPVILYRGRNTLNCLLDMIWDVLFYCRNQSKCYDGGKGAKQKRGSTEDEIQKDYKSTLLNTIPLPSSTLTCRQTARVNWTGRISNCVFAPMMCHNPECKASIGRQ